MKKIEGIKTYYYQLEDNYIMQIEEKKDRYETYLEMEDYSIKIFMIGFHKDSVKSLNEVLDIMQYNWQDFIDEYDYVKRKLED